MPWNYNHLTTRFELCMECPAHTEPVYAYIDESERDNTHYFLGGIVASEAQVEKITADMNALILEFGKIFPQLRLETEFHGSEIMNPSKGSDWQGIPLRVKFAIFRRVFTSVKSADARVFVEGIHHAALFESANIKLSPRERAFSHLLERINAYGFPDNPVHIVADDHHSAETSRSNFSRYRVTGTYGYKPNKLQNIYEELAFVDSKTNRVLQAADMATYIFNRKVTVQESNPKAVKEKEKLWEIFGHSIYTPGQGIGRVWPA